MATNFDKAIAAFLVSLIVFLGTKMGFANILTPDFTTGLETFIGSIVTALFVYFVPNKPAAPTA